MEIVPLITHDPIVPMRGPVPNSPPERGGIAELIVVPHDRTTHHDSCELICRLSISSKYTTACEYWSTMSTTARQLMIACLSMMMCKKTTIVLQ